MSPPQTTKTRSKEPLSKDRIVAAAIVFADENGLDDLSMRKLASALDVGAMSLYNHVQNKNELITAMVDEVMAKIEPPLKAAAGCDAATWRATMRASAISAHDAYLEHPWAVSAAMSAAPGPRRLRHSEATLAAFANSGLAPDPAHHAYHAYEVHITGYTLSQLAFRFDAAGLKDAARAFLTTVDADEFPNLVAHIHEHLEDRGSDFEFGLDLLLDGFERLRLSPT